MIHILDFIYDLRRDERAREKMLSWLEAPDGGPADAGAFRLERIPGTGEVRITLRDLSYPFRWKCPDYQCPAGELAGLIRAVCKPDQGPGQAL